MAFSLAGVSLGLLYEILATGIFFCRGLLFLAHSGSFKGAAFTLPWIIGYLCPAYSGPFKKGAFLPYLLGFYVPLTRVLLKGSVSFTFFYLDFTYLLPRLLA